MNRAVLLIPLLCGNLDEARILSILENTPHKELKKWEEENVPYTIRKQRMEFMNNIQKVEIKSLV